MESGRSHLCGCVIIEIDATNSNHRLEILDESGETVESLRYPGTSEEEGEQLARLYVLARRSALNVDSTLEKLAKALEL